MAEDVVNNRNPAPASSRLHEQARIRRDRVTELFAATRAACIVSPAYAGLLAAILWRPAIAGAPTAWLVAVALVTLGRLAIYRAFVRSDSR